MTPPETIEGGVQGDNSARELASNADAATPKSAAFTPGPWRVDPHHPIDIQTASGVDIGSLMSVEQIGEDWTIADAPRPSLAETLANARLIASAPRLVAALEELHNRTVIGTDAQRHAALDEAWAAIHEARGQ